jgi:hypothetical protein
VNRKETAVSEPYGDNEIPVPTDEEAGTPADEEQRDELADDELNWLD